MDGRLAAEPHASDRRRFGGQRCEVVEVEMRNVPGGEPGAASRVDEPAAGAEQAVPAKVRAQFGRQVGAAEHQRGQLRCTAVHGGGHGGRLLDTQRRLDQRDQRVEGIGGPGMEHRQVFRELDLGQQHGVEARTAGDQRRHIGQPFARAQSVEAHGQSRPLPLRMPHREVEYRGPRIVLACRMHGVLQVDADHVGAGRERLLEALGLLAGNEQHGARCVEHASQALELKYVRTTILSIACIVNTHCAFIPFPSQDSFE